MNDRDRALIERVFPQRWPASFRTFIEGFPDALGKILSAARDEGRAEGQEAATAKAAGDALNSFIGAAIHRGAEGLGGEWVMVPREPTREMLKAAGDYADECARLNYGGAPDAEGMWDAMLAVAPPASQAASQRESGWLVEHYASKRGEYLAEWLNGWPAFDDGAPEIWTKDSAKAIRFARREDAEQVIQALGWTEARATEHVWAATPVSQTQGDRVSELKSISVKIDPEYPCFALVGEPMPHKQHPNQQRGLDLYVQVINLDTGENCFKKLYNNARGLHFKHTGYSPMYVADFVQPATVYPFQWVAPIQNTTQEP